MMEFCTAASRLVLDNCFSILAFNYLNHKIAGVNQAFSWNINVRRRAIIQLQVNIGISNLSPFIWLICFGYCFD